MEIGLNRNTELIWATIGEGGLILAQTVHDLYFEPKYEELGSRMGWPLCLPGMRPIST